MAESDRTTGLVGNAGVKPPVRVATTGPITLSGEQTIDGVAVVADDRVLVKDQASGSANGIYVCDTGSWERSKDADGTYDWMQGTLVVVASGSTNGGSVFKQTTAGPFDIGTTSLAFSSMGLLATPVPVASGGTGGASATAGLANLGVVQVTAEAGTNTITGTVDALVTAYRADQLYILVPANTNTGATTFNPTPSGGSALGAKNVFWNGAACVGGELRAGVPVILQYDGTQFNVVGNSSAMPNGYFRGATVAAHATTMNPWATRVATLSGSAVTFTDIADAPYVGASVLLTMNAAHVWTDGAVFDVQGGATYTTAAGDQVLLVATAVDAFDVTIFPALGNVRGTFTATLTGCTTSVTGTANYSINGNVVTLDLPALTGTSNTTAATITGLPAAIQPVSTKFFPMMVQDNSTTAVSMGSITGGGGTLSLYASGLTLTFTGSGSKGLQQQQQLTYTLT